MRNKILLLMLAAVPGAASEGQLRLGLKEAVDLALAPDGSVRLRMAQELARQAELRSAQTRSALLPNLDAYVAEQNQTRNLAAFGIRIQIPLPGFQMPEMVGPFNVFDARASLTQTIFDFASLRRYQASRAAAAAARSDTESVRNQVIGQVARAYLAGVRAQAAVETGQANVALAEALVKLAGSQKAAGTGTGIEITRARVQLANERQRLLVAENEFDRDRLGLLRAIGLKLETAVELTDRLGYVPTDAATAREALERARKLRPELKAQRGREQAARLGYSATRTERLPSLVGFADYGTIGSGLDHALPTRTYGVSLRVPLFDGGRRDARRAESLSALRLERIRTKDVEDQVELEIRLALDNLRSADSQVKTAAEALALAESELEQARRRYEAGVAVGLEVTDAQTRLARARESRTEALFNHNLARIDLATATGDGVSGWK